MGIDTDFLDILVFLPLRFLLFNEAEVSSPFHVSSGLLLSSKGITKLIIEEKMWCILLDDSSSFYKSLGHPANTQHVGYGINSRYLTYYFLA